MPFIQHFVHPPTLYRVVVVRKPRRGGSEEKVNHRYTVYRLTPSARTHRNFLVSSWFFSFVFQSFRNYSESPCRGSAKQRTAATYSRVCCSYQGVYSSSSLFSCSSDDARLRLVTKEKEEEDRKALLVHNWSVSLCFCSVWF